MKFIYCPNKSSKEWKEHVKVLGEDIATLIWNRNNGNSLELTPKGKPSTLYNDILNKNNGDINATLKEKASYYLEGKNSWLESGIEPDFKIKEKVKIIEQASDIVPEEHINEPILDENLIYEPIIEEDYTTLPEDRYRAEALIKFRQDLLDYYHDRLNSISRKIRIETDSIEKAKLEKAHSILTETIYGNKVDKTNMLQQIEELKRIDIPKELFDYVRNDLDRMKELLNTNIVDNNSYLNLQEALDISKFYMRVMDADNNSLFTDEQIGDIIKGEDTELKELLRNWQIEAKEANSKARLVLRGGVVNVINDLDIIKRLPGFGGFTYESLTEAVADTNIISAYSLSPNRGDENKIPEIIIHLLRNSINEHLVLQQQQNNEMLKELPDVEKTLIALGETYNIVGKPGASYKLFYQKNEAGGFTNQLIRRYSYFYDILLKERKNEYKKEEKRIFGLAKTVDKDSLIQREKRKLLNWYKNNTNIFDFRKVSEIRDIIKKDSSLSALITVNETETITAKSLGITDKHFKELVDSQIEMLHQYQLEYNTKLSILEDEQGVSTYEKLTDERKFKLKLWNRDNSPLYGLNSFFDTSDKERVNDLVYNNLIPKKVDSKNKSTNYYDENFGIIEKHESLYNFRNTAEKIFEYMKDTLPQDIYNNFIENALPMHQKNYTETMVDLGIWGIGNKVISDLKDSFSTFKGTSTLSKKTGLTDHKVSAQFINENKHIIRSKFNITALEIANDIKSFYKLGTKVVDIKENSYINERDITGIVLDKLATMLNVNSNINEVKRVMNVKEEDPLIPVGRIIKNYVVNETIETSSFNLPKTLSYFSKLTAEYNARTEVIPMLNNLKELHKEVKTLNGKDRVNAVKAFEDQFNNKVLGIYSTHDWGISDKKVYSKEDRKRIAQINELLNDPNISEEDSNALSTERDNIGKNIAASRILMTLINLIRVKILGCNPLSEINNFFQGHITNEIIAASGKYFSHTAYYRSQQLYQMGQHREKFNHMLHLLDVFQDATNEYQEVGISTDMSLTKFGKFFKHYALRRVAEHTIQTPLMGAFLMDQQIIGEDGTTKVALWDAIDEEGKLKEGFRTQDNIDNWETGKGVEFNSLKGRIISALKAHGDFDELGNLLVRSSVQGRAFIAFKSWLPETVYKYWGGNHMNLEGGITNEKGIMLSNTPISGALLGFTTGAGFAGTMGGLLGAAAGFGIGMFNNNSLDKGSEINNVSALQELSIHAKVLYQKLAGLPLNRAFGRDIIGQTAIEEYEKMGFTQNDAQNLSAVMTQIAVQTYTLAMIMLIKGLLWSPDDEKNKARRMAYNLLTNRLMSLSNELQAYTNPIALYDTVSKGPMMTTITDVFTLSKDLGKFFTGEDIYLSGPYRGQHRVGRDISKLILPTQFKDIEYGGFNIYNSMTREYEPNKSIGTEWIQNLKTPEKDRRDKSRLKNRAVASRKLKEENPDMTSKELTKKLDRLYPPPFRTGIQLHSNRELTTF